MQNKFRLYLGLTLLMPVVLVIMCNLIVEWYARGKTFDQLSEVPKNKVGLVLGTSKHLAEGGMNPYYSNRVEATVALFEAGKIEFVLVSGDNGSVYYNEPSTIAKDLIAAGIPSEKIFLDYAGFRTLDSVIRAKVIFGLSQVTFISQEFHNKRAIYLAEKKGLEAIGFNASDISGNRFKVQVRESLARVKVFIDLLMNTQPRYYGDKILIE